MKISSLKKMHKGCDRVLDRLNYITIIQREQVTRGACRIFLILLKEKGESSFPIKQKDGPNCLTYIVRIQYVHSV